MTVRRYPDDSVKLRIALLLSGKEEVGLEDVKRHLCQSEFAQVRIAGRDGRYVAKMLNALGWLRNGTIGKMAVGASGNRTASSFAEFLAEIAAAPKVGRAA